MNSDRQHLLNFKDSHLLFKLFAEIKIFNMVKNGHANPYFVE